MGQTDTAAERRDDLLTPPDWGIDLRGPVGLGDDLRERLRLGASARPSYQATENPAPDRVG
jgi:hypothetical protein